MAGFFVNLKEQRICRQSSQFFNFKNTKKQLLTKLSNVGFSGVVFGIISAIFLKNLDLSVFFTRSGE